MISYLASGRAVCIIRVGSAVGRAETRDVSLHAMPWWRWALVGVVMLCLVVTLATRTFHDTTSSNSTTVQSSSPQAVRQHMDRDAVRWAAAVAIIAVAEAPTFYPRLAPAGPPLPTLLLEENLYNRPPPAC
jgi:drug/metabolite transporter (DMT)-like permease